MPQSQVRPDFAERILSGVCDSEQYGRRGPSDESPYLEVFTDEQKTQKAALESRIQELQQVLDTPTTEISAAQIAWETQLKTPARWHDSTPSALQTSSGKSLTADANGVIQLAESSEKDTYTIDVPVNTDVAGNAAQISAIQLQTLPGQDLPAVEQALAAETS